MFVRDRTARRHGDQQGSVTALGKGLLTLLQSHPLQVGCLAWPPLPSAQQGVPVSHWCVSPSRGTKATCIGAQPSPCYQPGPASLLACCPHHLSLFPNEAESWRQGQQGWIYLAEGRENTPPGDPGVRLLVAHVWLRGMLWGTMCLH